MSIVIGPSRIDADERRAAEGLLAIQAAFGAWKSQPQPIEMLAPKDRELVLGYYQARDSLPLGQAWPAEGVYVKRSTSFFGPDLTCAAQACGRPNGGELCLRISRLTGDSISEVAWPTGEGCGAAGSPACAGHVSSVS
jgi:hypothetical protein